MNVLILAAGHQPTDATEEKFPLCLAEFDGTPLIEAISHRLKAFDSAKFIVALQEKDVEAAHLDSIVKLLFPRSALAITRATTKGAACTALLAAQHIDNDDELLIISANELVDSNLPEIIADFKNRKLDAGTITFPSIHPRYSYIKADANGYIVEAAQKRPISREATVGIFWFAKGSHFVEAAKEMIRKGASTDGIFYICPTFNEIILKQGKIGSHRIEAKQYHPLKSERQITSFENQIESQGWSTK
ncbi:glycosyltransferase family 2 protein [Aquabacterium sp.]|uniref:glycosyltransferase family 2 protein n=1 Tax=Aquabacterium sp. TaxID=1872578 RepID=UPI0025C1B0C1|nr:glycosyltransferase family 2 protein [Aquabacterium sp.]